MNTKHRKLGLLTEIIGYIATYGTIFLLLIAIFSKGKFGGFIETVLILLMITILMFIGKSIYSLYKGYKKHLKEELNQKQFKRYWFKSFIGSMAIILGCLIFLTINLYDDYSNSNKKQIIEEKIESLENDVAYSISEHENLKEELRSISTPEFEFNLLFLVPILLLIPQCILLHKTNLNFIDKKYYVPKSLFETEEK